VVMLRWFAARQIWLRVRYDRGLVLRESRSRASCLCRRGAAGRSAATSFAALGLRSSAGPDNAAIDFPVLEDSATAEDEGLLLLWAIALGSVISVGFGVAGGAVLSHVVPAAVTR
jgi:hypothetical protein